MAYSASAAAAAAAAAADGAAAAAPGPVDAATGAALIPPAWDFRSDTVTVPDAGMAAAIAASLSAVAVGDDVKFEDPSVLALERHVAALCGHEAALFVASGTLSNQLALRVHVTQQAARQAVVHQRVVCDRRSHISEHEGGGAAFHSGTALLPVDVPDGEFLDAERVRRVVYLDDDQHTPVTSIVALENTIGGDVMPVAAVAAVAALCKERGIRLHIDGARLWNAAIAADVPVAEFTKLADSASLCLSKGLGAPIGSVLVGNKRFIAMARQYRKLFGAGWRQAGLLAAAGRYALDNFYGDSMRQVHVDSKELWRGLTELGFRCREPQSNTLWVKLPEDAPEALTWEALIARVTADPEDAKHQRRVLIEGEGDTIRLVLHHQTPKDAVTALLAALKSAKEALLLPQEEK